MSAPSMLKLKEFVLKRQSCFDFVKRTVSSKVNYLNLVTLSPDDIAKAFPVQSKCDNMFMLSYSLGRLLELSSGVEIVHAFAQLMVEYEYYISNAMQQNMKYLVSKPFPINGIQVVGTTPSRSRADSAVTDTFEPVLYSRDKRAYFVYLQTPLLLCVLDLVTVFSSLCDVLALVYDKFHDVTTIRPSVYEAMLNADMILKSCVLERIVSQLTGSAMNYAVGRELSNIASLLKGNQEESRAVLHALALDLESEDRQGL